MKRVSVTQLKNRLSEFLRMVKRGETIQIMERSVAIARIEGVGCKGDASPDEHLQRLIGEGIVQAPQKKPDHSLLKNPPLPCRLDPVQVLIEERGDR